jgi:hypothetical protein
MFKWLRKQGGKAEAPLTGAPEVRRLKSYSAASGYVYQYFYEGNRPAVRTGDAGIEYVFQVSADRRGYSPATVFVSEAVLDLWERGDGRDLNSSERYAVAKLALFQAFDERSSPAEMRQPVRVSLEHLKAFAKQFGFL